MPGNFLSLSFSVSLVKGSRLLGKKESFKTKEKIIVQLTGELSREGMLGERGRKRGDRRQLEPEPHALRQELPS